MTSLLLLVNKISKHRKRLNTWKAQQTQHGDTLSVCEAYDQEGYASMNTDLYRNRMYRKAIRFHSTKYWVEIGCGDSALLTRMVLDDSPHKVIHAFEVNHNSYQGAARVIEKEIKEGRAELTFADVNNKTTELFFGQEEYVLLHEIFGFWASGEGAPLTVTNTVTNYPMFKKVCPARAATFFTPVTVFPDQFKERDLYVSSKIILAKKFPLDKCQLADHCSCFEYYDFEKKPELVQERKHVFIVQKEGFLRGLGTFLWVGMGDSRRQRRRFDFYGDTTVNNYNGESYFTSRFFPGDNTHRATNWRNAVILIPEEQYVRKDERIEVYTRVEAHTTQPSYRFKITTSQKCQEIDISYTDLYPVFVKENYVQ